MNLGKNLKEQRKIKGYSQIDVSKGAKITQQALSLWEQNKRIPNIIDLIKVADFLEISLDELTEREHFF